MKKNLASLSLVSGLLLLSACSGTQPGTETPDDMSSSVYSSEASMESSDASVVGDVRIIDMTVSNFEFTPNVIRIAKGEKVQLRLTSSEGSHGIGIQGMNINVTVAAGETKVIDIPTDTAGTFAFFCSVPCGPGHKDMTGEIIIE